MVAGQTRSNKNNEVEIVDLNNPNPNYSSPPNFPFARFISSGGLGPDGNPLVCGGFGAAQYQQT